MRTLRNLSIIGIFLGILLVLSSSTILIFQRKANTITFVRDESSQKVQAIEKNIDNTEKEILPISDIKESGWIPNWAFELGYESVENNVDILHTVNPVIYTLDSNGNVILRSISNQQIDSIRNLCNKNGIRIIPTISVSDYNSTNISLSTYTIRRKNIEKILEDINKFNFGGIDIDYERISSSDKENYLAFLRELKVELGKMRKTLSVSVFPQWHNGTYHTEQIESISVQDYAEIGRIADEVRIMAYDYTLQTSRTPGPVSPISWVRDILDYAVRMIPREKVWLGVPLYSYEWINGKTVALTYTSVYNLLSNSNISPLLDSEIGESYAEFACNDGEKCYLYFQNKESIQKKREIAKEYRIAGVSYWRLGGEMELLK